MPQSCRSNSSPSPVRRNRRQSSSWRSPPSRPTDLPISSGVVKSYSKGFDGGKAKHPRKIQTSNMKLSPMTPAAPHEALLSPPVDKKIASKQGHHSVEQLESSGKRRASPKAMEKRRKVDEDWTFSVSSAALCLANKKDEVNSPGDPLQSPMDNKAKFNPPKLFFIGHLSSETVLVADDTRATFVVSISLKSCSCHQSPRCQHVEFLMRLPSPAESVILASQETAVQSLVCQICFEDVVDDYGISCLRGCSFFAHEACCQLWAEVATAEIASDKCPKCQSVELTVTVEDYSTHLMQHQQQQEGFLLGNEIYKTPSSASLSSGNGLGSCVAIDEDLECGGLVSDIPLPEPSDPVLERHWPTTQGWIGVLGKTLVACLMSKDWVIRTAALRRLAREVANSLRNSYYHIHHENTERLWKCCTDVLAQMTGDKVCKVYLTALRCLKTLLVFTRVPDDGPNLQGIKHSLRPVLHRILAKCADGNKRVSELSLETIIELCKGSEGKLCLGRYAPGNQANGDSLGIDFILQLILEDSHVEGTGAWQAILGKLLALERMMQLLMHFFSLPANARHTPQYYRTMVLVDFSFRHLASSHPNVSKRARNLFVTTAKAASSDPETCREIIELLVGLDPTLQIRLKKRLKIVLSTDYCMLLDKTGVWSPPLRSCSDGHAATVNLKGHKRSQHSPTRLFSCRRSTKRLGLTGKSPATKKAIRPRESNLDEFSSHCTEEEINGSPFSTLEFNGVEANGAKGAEFVRTRDEGELLPHSSFASSSTGCTSIAYKEGLDWKKGPLLGSGAYSICYQARDVKSGTIMAVKQISISAMSSSCTDLGSQLATPSTELSDLAREEVKMLLSMRHPHVLRTFGAFRENNHVNVFVEWMAGGSVAALLDKFGPFSDDVIKNYLFQTLMGLSYLHGNGILHRDLKGANLLVDSTGQHLRIGDFGSAINVTTLDKISSDLKGQIQGTIAFMAPEVLRGESYGPSADIWSIGCCVVEMATAKPPWNASDVSNHLALIFKIACSSSPPIVPTTLCPTLVHIATCCLDRTPASRPSGEDLLRHPLFSNPFH